MSLTALTAIVALTGCASVPESVRGTSANPQQDLVRVMNAPALYVGQESRFGGKVVKVDNLNGRTRLELVTVPLDDGARPMIHQPSVGRIIAYVSGFLEPTDFNRQWVTVVGPITGTERGAIDQAAYDYVVVQAQGYKRWQLAQQVIAPMGPPISPWGGPFDRGWGPYYGGFGWGGYYGGDARVETVITE
ncbi:Slp family lipoprotein [Acerihabitans sp. KWT182]|uniref:Slp family lipoprotein n=1 Tax=Acerihabitans sp. KWT182 TaxID=3157919 RepID=A0AAU7QG31_9GAMM